MAYTCTARKSCQLKFGVISEPFFMGYSLGYFSDFGSFLKVAVTRKIEVRISSNLVHSIFTSICIKKCNKNLG